MTNHKETFKDATGNTGKVECHAKASKYFVGVCHNVSGKPGLWKCLKRWIV